MKCSIWLMAIVLSLVMLPSPGQALTLEMVPEAPSSRDTIRIRVTLIASCPFLSEPAVVGRLVVLSFHYGGCLFPPTEITFNRFVAPLSFGPYRLVLLDNQDGDVIQQVPFTVTDAGTPPVPDGAFLESSSVPGFRFKVRITAQGESRMAEPEPDCLPETLCASGALDGRSEVLLRVVGPKPNGYLWPTFVRFTTSRVEVWVEKIDTGEVKYYWLGGAVPLSEELEGRFDRHGFLP